MHFGCVDSNIRNTKGVKAHERMAQCNTIEYVRQCKHYFLYTEESNGYLHSQETIEQATAHSSRLTDIQCKFI